MDAHNILDGILTGIPMVSDLQEAIAIADKNGGADVMVIALAPIVLEGQGSLMNPAYQGGFELLAAGRPEHSRLGCLCLMCCMMGLQD